MTDETRAGLNARTDPEEPPTQKHDGPALGRGELHVPADDAVVLTDGGNELLADGLIAALEASRCHPDMVRYAELAADRGGTPILNSLRHFHRATDVSRITEIGTQIEKTLWNHGARPTLDRHAHLDDTNTEILREIAQEHGDRLMTDGGRDLPRFEYREDGISTGDVVVDLSSGKSLQVVGESTQTVGEHPETRSDATAEMFGADPDGRVLQCVFLPDGERASPPKKTYAYPESRLLRYPVERATEYDGPIQTWLRTAFLNELADGVSRSGNTELETQLVDLVEDVYNEDIAETFRELIIEFDGSDGRAMTDGGQQIDREPGDGESFDLDGNIRPVPPHVGDPSIRTNGGESQRFPELPDFQRDLLLTLARSQPTHGQGLRDDLGALRDEDVNDGRLYPNLNSLVDLGLVEKRENVHDDRSHEYVLSAAGVSSVREHARRVSAAVYAIGDDEEVA